jgi:hypothetical protein
VGEICVVCNNTGTVTCTPDGLSIYCSGVAKPKSEKCDGKDNDCDGKIDEGDDICPDGKICFKGHCIQD